MHTSEKTRPSLFRSVPHSAPTASQNTKMASEPPGRAWHCSAAVDREVFIYGGFGESEEDTQLFSFSADAERWNDRIIFPAQSPCIADEYGCAFTSAGHLMYFYGKHSYQDYYPGCLYQLDTKTLDWTLLSQVPPGGGGDYPIHKSGCRMVHYDDKLWLFGGIGRPPTGLKDGDPTRTTFGRDYRRPKQPDSNGPLQPGADYSGGFTNELHMFDLKEGEIHNFSSNPLAIPLLEKKIDQ